MQFSTSTGNKNDPIGEGDVAGKYVLLLIHDIENSVEIQTMLERSIKGAKAFDRAASGTE